LRSSFVAGKICERVVTYSSVLPKPPGRLEEKMSDLPSAVRNGANSLVALANVLTHEAAATELATAVLWAAQSVRLRATHR